jgi:hypothetical protein
MIILREVKYKKLFNVTKKHIYPHMVNALNIKFEKKIDIDLILTNDLFYAATSRF